MAFVSTLTFSKWCIVNKQVGDAGARLGKLAFSTGAMDAMTRLSEATRFKGAVEFGIWPFLLISGARGSGKFTMASSIARRLGIHIAEVRSTIELVLHDIYSLLTID